MILYLVIDSSMLSLPKTTNCEHTLVTKYAYPKNAFEWFVKRRKKEIRRENKS